MESSTCNSESYISKRVWAVVEQTDPTEGHKKRVRSAPIKLNLPDDGHVWHKYGQKFINEIKKRRNYYCCSMAKSTDCPAKRRVDFCVDNTADMTIDYMDNHNHSPRECKLPNQWDGRQIQQDEAYGRMAFNSGISSTSTKKSGFSLGSASWQQKPLPSFSHEKQSSTRQHQSCGILFSDAYSACAHSDFGEESLYPISAEFARLKAILDSQYVPDRIQPVVNGEEGFRNEEIILPSVIRFNHIPKKSHMGSSCQVEDSPNLNQFPRQMEEEWGDEMWLSEERQEGDLFHVVQKYMAP